MQETKTPVVVSERSRPNELKLVDPRLVDIDGSRARLKAGQCRQCKAYSFPRADVCASCLSEDVADAFLSEEGKLYSFSTIYKGPPGWIVPYTLGYVDLPEGVRVLANLDIPQEQLRVDLKVRLGFKAIAKDADGSPLQTYVFRE